MYIIYEMCLELNSIKEVKAGGPYIPTNVSHITLLNVVELRYFV